MNKLKSLYQWSPALCNAVIALVLILVNQFVPSYADQIKAIVDALIALLAGAATYPQVTPVAKLNGGNNE